MHPPLTTRPGAAPRPGFPAPVWREAPAIPANTLRWNPAIPVGAPYWRQIGLAGPLVGVHGDHLLVGGGANFPEPGRTANEPNTLGKVFWNELFVLDLARETWLAKPFALDRALAYAATLSLPEGVLVIGGEGFAGGPNGTRLGPLEKFADVSLLSFDPARAALACTEYPALPAASSYGAAALLGRTAYYQTGGDFMALDLDRPGEGWRVLPSWPGEPRDAAVAAAVGGRIVIATGQTRAGEGWHIHTDAFAYDPARATWERLADMPFAAMAGMGFGCGDRLLVVGGDRDVARWNLITGMAARRALLAPGSPEWEELGAALVMVGDHHLGFNTEILAWEADADAWSVAGRFPGAAPVTTQPARWRDRLIVAGGEVRPGIRSPRVWISTPRG